MQACEQSERFDVCQFLITPIPFSPASILVFCLSYSYFCHLKPETNSESLHRQDQQNLQPSSRGRKWGRRKGANGSLVRNRFGGCPAFCESRDQAESGPQGPRRAAHPSRVKNRPANLAFPSGERAGGLGARESFLPRSAARGSEPGLAEDDGSLSARSSNTLARLEVIYTPVGVFEGHGKPQLRSPSPLQPEEHPNPATVPGCSAGAQLLSQRRCPGPGCPRAGGGHKLRPCCSEPRAGSAHPLLGAVLRERAAVFRPAARSWARRSRRGQGAPAGPDRGLAGHAYGSRCGQGTGEGWIYPDRGKIRPSSLLEGVLLGRKDATGPRAAGLLLPVYGGDAGDCVVVADALGQ